MIAFMSLNLMNPLPTCVSSVNGGLIMATHHCVCAIYLLFTLHLTYPLASSSSLENISTTSENVICLSNSLSLRVKREKTPNEWKDDCFNTLSILHELTGVHYFSRYGPEHRLPCFFPPARKEPPSLCPASLDMDSNFEMDMIDFSVLYELAWSVMTHCIFAWAGKPWSIGGYIDGVGEKGKLRFKLGRVQPSRDLLKQDNITVL